MLKFCQAEYWMFQNILARLVNLSTHFQIFKIQIPEKVFNQMLKAWIAQNFLHILDQVCFYTSCGFEKIQETNQIFQKKICGIFGSKAVYTIKILIYEIGFVFAVCLGTLFEIVIFGHCVSTIEQRGEAPV